MRIFSYDFAESYDARSKQQHMESMNELSEVFSDADCPICLLDMKTDLHRHTSSSSSSNSDADGDGVGAAACPPVYTMTCCRGQAHLYCIEQCLSSRFIQQVRHAYMHACTLTQAHEN